MGSEEQKQQVMDFLEGETPEGFEEEPMPDGDEDIFGYEDAEEDVENDDSGEAATAEGQEPEGDSPTDSQDDADAAQPPADNSGDDGESPEGVAEGEAASKETDEGDVVGTLRSQIEELQGMVAELKKAPAQETSGDGEQQEPKQMTLKDGEVLDFVGEADLDELLSDKNKFNEFLSGFANQIRNNTTEQVYRNMPQMVQTQVQSQQQLKTYVDEFYKSNEDLLPVRKTVGAVANEISAEHPEYDLDTLFTETEAKVRKMMGLKKEALENKPQSSESRSQSPALPQRGARRSGGGPKKLTGQEKHIQDVL